MAVDHLSCLEDPNDDILEGREINDTFPWEQICSIQVVVEDETLWFADISNYLATKTFPKWFTHQQRKKFFANLKHYIWEDPYLFRVCSDHIVRMCVLVEEGQIS